MCESEKASTSRIERLREILHLIGREAGPAAAAAMSGLALAATGGMFAGVMAVEQLFKWLSEIKKEADEAAENIRTKMAESMDVITQAKQAIDDLDQANENFWNKLAASSAEAGVKSDFEILLKNIKDPAAQTAFRETRANELQSSLDALTDQLKAIQSSKTNGNALTEEADLISAKKDLENANAAFKAGTAFQPSSKLIPYGFSAPGDFIGDAATKQSDFNSTASGTIQTIQHIIATAEQNNKNVTDHQQLLEQTIERMTKEKDSLTSKNDSAKATFDVGALSRAESIADRGSQNQTEQQFVMRMADAASGHALNLQQAENYLQQIEKMPMAIGSILTRLMAVNQIIPETTGRHG